MNKSDNQVRIVLLLILLLVTILRYFLELNTTLSKLSLSATLVTVLLVLFLFFFRHENNKTIKANFFLVSSLVVIGFVIVHFFEYWAYVIGEHDAIIDVDYIDTRYVNEAALCSCASLIAMLTGYLYTKTSFKHSFKDYVKDKKLLEIAMLVCLVVFYITAGSYYFNGGYGDVLNNIGLSLSATISQTLLQACQVACAVTLIYKNERCSIKQYIRSYSLIYYITLLIYCYLVVSSGDRGPLFQVAICYVAPYFIVNKVKLRILPAIILLCFAAFFFSLLGTVRSMDGNLNFSKIEEAQQFRTERFKDDNIVFTSTAELSNVVRSYHVLYYYARTNGYLYGVGFINQIIGIIPGLRYMVYPLLGINDDEFTTAVISTKLLHQDHGMGSTCVADTFYNFGFWGTICVFILFGCFMRKLDISTYEDSETIHPFWCCTIICYLMFGIYIGRGYLFSPINVLAYSYAMFFINNKLRK